MNRRRLLAAAGLVCVALLAGCFGPSQISDEQLAENATYDWSSEANASYTLARSSYAAVFRLSNSTTLAVHDRDALGVEAPVDLSALRYRFPNGTIIDGTHDGLSATLEQRRTVIDLPVREGQVAYTASRSGKQFTTPVVVSGQQAVTLPPGGRVGVPLLSQVSPAGHTTAVMENRMTVTWENVTGGALTVNYYLQRDLVLFSLLVLVASAIGIGGIIFYVRQIRRLAARREDVGLDIEEDDDDPRDRGPPPGMR
ncbi:MAG: DUF5803 family protein [Salinirussus sp.]